MFIKLFVITLQNYEIILYYERNYEKNFARKKVKKSKTN